MQSMPWPNSSNVNLVSSLWCILSASRVLSFSFPDYFKSVEIHEPLRAEIVVAKCHFFSSFFFSFL